MLAGMPQFSNDVANAALTKAELARTPLADAAFCAAGSLAVAVAAVALALAVKRGCLTPSRRRCSVLSSTPKAAPIRASAARIRSLACSSTATNFPFKVSPRLRNDGLSEVISAYTITGNFTTMLRSSPRIRIASCISASMPRTSSRILFIRSFASAATLSGVTFWSVSRVDVTFWSVLSASRAPGSSSAAALNRPSTLTTNAATSSPVVGIHFMKSNLPISLNAATISSGRRSSCARMASMFRFCFGESAVAPSAPSRARLPCALSAREDISAKDNGDASSSSESEAPPLMSDGFGRALSMKFEAARKKDSMIGLSTSMSRALAISASTIGPVFGRETPSCARSSDLPRTACRIISSIKSAGAASIGNSRGASISWRDSTLDAAMDA